MFLLRQTRAIFILNIVYEVSGSLLLDFLKFHLNFSYG